VALPESFDKLDLDEGSVDCVVSTYMLCKDKNPEASFAKAMRSAPKLKSNLPDRVVCYIQV
jgi:hypothetical protein